MRRLPAICRAVPLLGLVLASCGRSGVSGRGNGSPPRTYRLGFAALAPRPETPLILSTIDLWTRRADIALMQSDVPWRSLLADTSARLLVQRDQLPLANLYRGRGLPIVLMVEPENGLARDRESDALTALGRSITEPRVQQAYRDFVLAADSQIHPDYLGLVIESNLIRETAPARLYDAVRSMAGTTAAALQAKHSTARLLVSVQVDVAWGRLTGGAGYRGVAQDLVDFPFVRALGLSAYPYLAGFARAEDVPLDYYARIGSDAHLPVLVTEGGWSSATLGSLASSPEQQAHWIARQMQLADSARAVAVLQIPFTDLDLAAWGAIPEAQTLALFAHIGLVDANLQPKPALAVWDSAFHRPHAGP